MQEVGGAHYGAYEDGFSSLQPSTNVYVPFNSYTYGQVSFPYTELPGPAARASEHSQRKRLFKRRIQVV